MQPKIIIKGEMAIHGLRGDGADTGALWGKFEKRYTKKPFEKVGDNAYEIRTFDGKKPTSPGRDILVGHERTVKKNDLGYQCMVLPAGEYAVFDVLTANGYESENSEIEKWLSDNSRNYKQRELYDNNFVVECYVPEKFQGGDKPDSVVEMWVPVTRVGSSAIPELLQDPCFRYIGSENRDFISAFDDAMEKQGYSAGNTIVNGICWGRNMLIYTKMGAKSSSVAARIYMRDGSICLRLFLNNITKHAEYIENAPDFIKSVFTGEYGKCKHCKGDNCKFRKDYEIDGERYEKCNGVTFEFYETTVERLPEYIKLFNEFYPQRKKSGDCRERSL